MVIGSFRGTNQRVLTITIVLHKAKKEVIQCPVKYVQKQHLRKRVPTLYIYLITWTFLRVIKHLGNLKSRVCHSLVHTTAK